MEHGAVAEPYPEGVQQLPRPVNAGALDRVLTHRPKRIGLALGPLVPPVELLDAHLERSKYHVIAAVVGPVCGEEAAGGPGFLKLLCSQLCGAIFEFYGLS
jgi:hypothetical protein